MRRWAITIVTFLGVALVLHFVAMHIFVGNPSDLSPDPSNAYLALVWGIRLGVVVLGVLAARHIYRQLGENEP